MLILQAIENCNKENRVINESFLPAPHHVRILNHHEFPEDTGHNKCYCGLVENQEADSLYQY
ncbi:hypothetical protein ANSO36C_31680 [Nostoc cf. commune SO-36]|uniref:Uncharacterized protein n=1 Tax=Nostoc cf. commune SO-36 TaxID=449208 RepID=A0ABM7Z2Y5_NOSCO|nr:hypothetical protein ANSO36C_31680 [Nostoc cf. commune SO-36]